MTMKIFIRWLSNINFIEINNFIRENVEKTERLGQKFINFGLICFIKINNFK